jgi:hypothetical protein
VQGKEALMTTTLDGKISAKLSPKTGNAYWQTTASSMRL